MTDAATRASRARTELTETDAAFNVLRDEYTRELFATSRDQIDKRERLFLAVNVLEQVRRTLTAVVAGGQIEAVKLKIAEHSSLLRP